ncbi:MFS transporter [Streptomyces rubradiris]|uniref:MFS transporter n=1 Tax=Streptomyces rubradiris TaxID=285531 RepID=A0ABQ3R986_STRRR|nr:MFS transporter [Streptomyces rubradiris]GHG99620.1 MFS transporter [Streptomyces rubradiris]GHI52416.1 MFS transporter [Streptomyces rubradiris]
MSLPRTGPPSPAAAPAVPRSRRCRPGAVLVVESVAVFMVMLDNLAMNNALPDIGRDLAVGVGGLEWVVASYTLVLAAFLLPGSIVGERLGRRRLFLAGLAAFTLGSALGATADSWAMLVTGRIVQGAGGAALLPSSAALLRQVFPEDATRARALGLRGAASGLGLALGPVIGGPLVERFGWQSVLLINVPIGVCLLLFGAFFLPYAPPCRSRPWDLPGQALAAVGVGGLIFALIQGPSEGWTDPAVLAGFTAAGLALPALLAVEARAAEPMIDLSFFRDRLCAVAALAGFSTSLALFGAIFFLSLYLQYILGWSPAGAGLVFLLASAFIVVTGPVAGRLSARRSAFRPLLVGVTLCPLALAGLAGYGENARYAEYCWVLPVIGVCVSLTFVPVNVIVVQRVRGPRAGMATAIAETLRELGGVTGVAALGAVLNSRMRDSFLRQAEAVLPADQATALADRALAHGPAAALAGPGAGAVRRWFHAAFLDGLHAALYTGAVATAVVAVCTYLMVRTPAAAPADEPGALVRPTA